MIGKYILVGAVVGGALVLIVGRDYLQRRRVRRQLAARPELDDDAFAADFPPEQQAVAREIRRLIQPHVPCAASRLRADDALLGELDIDGFDKLAFRELLQALEAHYDLVLPTREELAEATVGNLVAVIVHLQREAATTPSWHAEATATAGEGEDAPPQDE